MEGARKPDDEIERLAALYALDILDSGTRESIDRVTRMARRIFNVPIALVTFIDDERQWVMSGFGSPCDLPRSTSFCGYAILSDEVMAVPDTTRDPRFADSPFVDADPSIRFYAGAPLTLGGYRVGTICVFDEKPRELSDDETELLKDLAGSVESEFASAHRAVVDELTGLYNRRGFHSAGGQLCKLAERNAVPITVFAFDIDDLKTVNDRDGHAAGDALIEGFAGRLRSTFRASDTLARMGGDEFAALVYGPCDTGVVIERLSGAAGNELEGSDAIPRFSTGWVTSEPGEATSLRALLEAADKQMYADKQARKGGAR